MDSEASAARQERRVHHRVRAVFREACDLIAPLLIEPQPSVSSFGLAHMLRAHYPQLTDTEIHVLIAAATRYLQGRP